jgi:transcriptional regulator GlxA family with amidase domain
MRKKVDTQRLTATIIADEEKAGRSPSFPLKDEEGQRRAKSTSLDKPKNILEVVAFIEANLWSPLELEGLAEKAHLSKFHFCRIFKRYIGMNPMKYVAALRIEQAKKLLKKNELTVSVVANKVGFKDMSNFIRQFKKATGVTPTMYRGAAEDKESPGTSAFAVHQ